MKYYLELGNDKDTESKERFPLVTILAISYNNSNFIFDLLDSIVQQDYPNIELIISDDGSLEFDDSAIKEYILKNAKNNIVSCYINRNEKNMKTVAHVEKLIDIAKGEYITIIAADDAYYDGSVLSQLMNEFGRDDAISVVMGQTLMYDNRLETLLHKFTSDEDIKLINSLDYDALLYTLSKRCIMPAAGIIYKKEIFETVGNLSSDYFLVEDWTTHLRLIRHRVKMLFLDINAVKHRNGGVSHSKTGMNPGVWEDIIRGMELEIFPYIDILTPIQQLEIRKVYAGRIYAYERDKALYEKEKAADEYHGDKEIVTENKKVEIPIVSYEHMTSDNLLKKLERWDAKVQDQMHRIASKTLPYSWCKVLLFASPLAYKRRIGKLYRKYPKVFSPFKKIYDKVKTKYQERDFAKQYEIINKSYNQKLVAVQKEMDENGKVKVAFLIIYDSVFPAIAVFEKMKKLSMFDPYIIVVPEISRGMDFLQETYRKTLENMKEKYGEKVLGAYDIESNNFIELGNQYSLVFFANPYKESVHPYHHIDYFLDKKVLTVYMDYGFPAVKYAEYVYSTDLYAKVWLAVMDSEISKQMLKKHQIIKAKNAIVAGYAKMDMLSNVEIRSRKRKKVIICPHHTVTNWKPLDLSNFERYENLYLRIAKDFPEIDFVFRPHPLLFMQLRNNKGWSKEKLDNYITRLLEAPNMELDQSSEYFDLFMNSDAMIHDCSSFIGEYLFTEKPCCYMLKSPEQIQETFSELGQKCIKQYYHAYTEEEIYEFICKVVIAGEDSLKQQREKFVKTELKKNYPHSTDQIINYLTKKLSV